ncbi:MAG: hypothetical protein QOD03_1654 [Verrucomicrobiota bacterium]|jgi:hypothetical protein
MKLLDLEKKMIAMARANPPGDHVPFAFEKRIMALINARPALDNWAFWARALWFAAAPCVAVTLLFSSWAYFHPADNNANLAQQFDNTLFAAVDNDSSR